MQQRETKKTIPYSWGEEVYFLYTSKPGRKILTQNDYRIIRIFTTDKNFQTAEYPYCIIRNTTTSDDKEYWIVQAIRGDIEIFGYIKNKEHTIGASFTKEKIQQYFLTDIRGDFEEVFDQVQNYIETNLEILRMWNFIENIHQNYPVFNKVRDAFSLKNKIEVYSAATGIEADLGGNLLSLSVDMIASSKDIEITTLHSDLQNEAYDYGPKFSRGKVVYFKKEGVKKIYISGTSSINQKGESVFCNSPKENVAYVLDCVENLLKKTQSDLDKVVMSIIYCQDERHHKAFLSLYKKRQWNFPYMPLFVNICRPDLSFEMECIAWS